MLHGENADVLSLLSSLGPGLLVSKSHFEVAIAYLDDVLKDASSDSVLKDTSLGDDLRERFTGLRAQLHDLDRAQTVPPSTVLDIDVNKSFLLAHTFPKQYNEALALLVGKSICLELWARSESPLALVEQYMCGQSSDAAVFVRMKEAPEKEETREIPSDPLVRINQLLEPLRYTFTRDGLEPFESTPAADSHDTDISVKHALLPTAGFVHVDPYTWFCSCCAFQASCQEGTVCRKRGLEIVREENLQEEKNYSLLRFLANSPCFHPDRLPMCKHLLAVLLAAANWEVARAEKLIEIVEIQSINK